jgi:hypothetical protein
MLGQHWLAVFSRALDSRGLNPASAAIQRQADNNFDLCFVVLTFSHRRYLFS